LIDDMVMSWKVLIGLTVAHVHVRAKHLNAASARDGTNAPGRVTVVTRYWVSTPSVRGTGSVVRSNKKEPGVSRQVVRRHVERASLVISLVLLAVGLVLHGLVDGGVATGLFFAGTVLGIMLSTWWVAEDAFRRRIGVDVIALLALVGALVVGEQFAGAVITVMLTTGRSLEGWAAGRAERELHALLQRAPKVAHRYVGEDLTDPPLDDVTTGDRLLVQPGEVVPVDGTVFRGPAVVDESALTGESLPVQREIGDEVRSGAVNAGGPFDLLATTGAANSTYAGIVRLVSEASASTSPFVRTADRYATGFLAITFAVAGGAWWWSASLDRAVAVLVVATPCPLILAAPVAIVAGLSRAAERGVVVKGGGALEALAAGDVLLFDKTGTLTNGRPTVDAVITAPDAADVDVLGLAASLDQVSPHVLASAIVRAARDRNLELVMPTETEEVPGAGVRGRIGGHEVTVGNAAWVGATGREPWVIASHHRTDLDGALTVFVGVDGHPAGALVLRDPIRHDAARTIRNLRRSGIRRVVMVTGDRAAVAFAVGQMVGVDHIDADQSPADKVAVVRRETLHGRTIMVGDGINDAPALALATVGVAIGARGSTASSEAADVVLTIDRLDRLGDARLIAVRSRSIAVQSVALGMVLSCAAMGVAAAGLLPAAVGALVQEVIDVTAILSALRALRAGRGEVRMDDATTTLAHRFTAAHLELRPNVGVIREAADLLGAGAAPAELATALVAVRRAHRVLVDEIEPHELEEDRDFYPMMASVLGGTDPTGTMSRSHAEISRMTAHVGSIIERIGDGLPDTEQTRELQRLLYGLYAILELHFAQEDEHYLSLADTDPEMPSSNRSSA
jgi:heavy metal translocating P-type ATPase